MVCGLKIKYFFFLRKIAERQRKMDHSVDPPPLSITIPKLVDQQVSCKPWEFIRHPTDVLLLTVADDEFLNCFFYFHNAFRSYKYGLGYVYFGEIDDGPGSIKVSLIRCCSGSSSPGASHNVAKNAIQCLRPKAVFSVGFCSGLRKDKIELGDVVISAKLSTYSDKKIIDDQEQWCGHTLQVSRNIGDLIRSAADGWKAPLNDPEAREVKVHRDAEVLTGPELANSPKTSEELRKEFPGAVAIEAEGQGNSPKSLKNCFSRNVEGNRFHSTARDEPGGNRSLRIKISAQHKTPNKPMTRIIKMKFY